MRLGIGLALAAGAVAAAAACAVPPAPIPPPLPPAPAPMPAPTPAPVVVPAPLLRIMPLGDSITSGRGSSDGAGYRADLARRLAAAGFRVDFVGSQDAGPAGADDDNEGHGGWTIAQLAAGADGWLAGYRPDVILLHAGTNDLRGTDGGTAAGRLGMLLGRIRRDAPATRIFVAQIVGSRNPSQQRRIASYNADVARIVAAYRDPLLYLVNLGAVRAPHVHPNDAGYAAMANLWFAAVARVEDEPRSGQPWIGL